MNRIGSPLQSSELPAESERRPTAPPRVWEQRLPAQTLQELAERRPVAPALAGLPAMFQKPQSPPGSMVKAPAGARPKMAKQALVAAVRKMGKLLPVVLRGPLSMPSAEPRSRSPQTAPRLEMAIPSSGARAHVPDDPVPPDAPPPVRLPRKKETPDEPPP